MKDTIEQTLAIALETYHKLLDGALSLADTMGWQVDGESAFVGLDKTRPRDAVLSWYQYDGGGVIRTVNFPIRMLTATPLEVAIYRAEYLSAKDETAAALRRKHVAMIRASELLELERLRKKHAGSDGGRGCLVISGH